ncbi:MAG TPA: FlgD immunoglobulin-like domain containing protein [Gaiellaceae bacterium]|nr:FlgD immunoglobulin-like domain containing protein [Gaiellaceae bacterium]
MGLLIATAAAFAITERLKLVKSPITNTLVTRVFSPAHDQASIQVRLRHTDMVTVTVLTPGKRLVRTLVDNKRLPRGANVFTWGGRTDAGALAPQGAYRVEIHLRNQHRTILLPNVIELDTTAPVVKLAAPNRDAFSPDGDHQADSVIVHYALSEQARAVIYFRGHKILGPTHSHQPTGKLTWFGRAGGVLLSPGAYTLEVGAIDAAGNVTPAADRWPVRIRLRYIVLANRHITGVKAGTKFDIGVSTDARRYGWLLGSRHGFARGPVLGLRAPARPGTYPLTVTEHGHSDRALVVVR